MTKQAAIKALSEGKRLTHKSWKADTFIYESGKYRHIIFEDGGLFAGWHGAYQKNFMDGWEIYKPKIPPLKGTAYFKELADYQKAYEGVPDWIKSFSVIDHISLINFHKVNFHKNIMNQDTNQSKGYSDGAKCAVVKPELLSAIDSYKATLNVINANKEKRWREKTASIIHEATKASKFNCEILCDNYEERGYIVNLLLYHGYNITFAGDLETKILVEWEVYPFNIYSAKFAKK